MGKASRRKLFGLPKKRERIFIAVPTNDNRVTLSVADFITYIERINHVKGAAFEFDHRYLNGVRPHAYARNRLVGEFLRSKSDRMWFIDADMLPQNSAGQLIHCDADVCAGRMFKFDHADPNLAREPGVKLCAFTRNHETGMFNPIVPNVGDRILDVDGVGTGSMLIRRHVLEDKRLWLDDEFEGLDGVMRRTLETRWGPEDHEYAPPIFRMLYLPNGGWLIGEDLDFSWRAKKLGYSVKVDLGAQFGHYKEVDINQALDMAHGVLKRYDAVKRWEAQKNDPDQVAQAGVR